MNNFLAAEYHDEGRQGFDAMQAAAKAQFFAQLEALTPEELRELVSVIREQVAAAAYRPVRMN